MLTLLKKWWNPGCRHDWAYIDSDMTSTYGSWHRLHNRVCLKCEKIEDDLSRAKAIDSERKRLNDERMHRAICIWDNRGEKK